MHHDNLVHIVDDDEAVRNALSLLMQSEDISAQVYASAEEFLNKNSQPGPGCLLLDVRMPGMDGLQLLDMLNDKNCSIPVIFITGHGDVAMAVKAMKAGAVDFIEKPFSNERLLLSIRKCLSECCNIASLNESRMMAEDKIARLTKRERQVMDLLVDGKQNKVIAQELGISPRTVELHRAKVMTKLSATSLSEVVRTALLTNGIV